MQEPPGTVLAGRMPRSKEAILVGELVDAVKPGDMVKLTGVYKAQYDVELNAQQSFPVFKTELLVNNIRKKNDFRDTDLTEEEIRAIKKLAQQPDIR